MNKYSVKNVIEKGKTNLEQLDAKVNFITWALLIIVGGLLFTLGGILNDSWAIKQASYQSLTDKVNILIEQNNIKSDDLKITRINQLEQEIKDLKKANYLK